MGWVDTPDRHVMVAEQGFIPLAQAAPHLMMDQDNTKDVLLYKAWLDLLGKFPDYLAQDDGDCTSMGWGHGTDLNQAIEIVIGKESEEYKETCTEAFYALGREEANMLGRGAGCYGAAMAKVATTIGVIPRELVGAYDGDRVREWGRRGLPQQFRDKLRGNVFEDAALVTTLPELDAWLNSGNVCPICSNYGFNTPRDSTGLCQQRGTWNHCMLVIGRRFRNGKPQYCIAQSWGPNMPTGPLADGQPSFSFWIEAGPMAGILAQKDSFAPTRFKGYPAKKLPEAWMYFANMG